MSQQKVKKTNTPARIVRSGGPAATLLVSFTTGSSLDGFWPEAAESEFVAETVNCLWFFNLMVPSNLYTSKARKNRNYTNYEEAKVSVTAMMQVLLHMTTNSTKLPNSKY